MKMRCELKITLEDWDNNEHEIGMFMHISNSADDDHIAEIVMDQVEKQIEECPETVIGHATLMIPEQGVQYEFSYVLGRAGNWEHQVMH